MATHTITIKLHPELIELASLPGALSKTHPLYYVLKRLRPFKARHISNFPSETDSAELMHTGRYPEFTRYYRISRKNNFSQLRRPQQNKVTPVNAIAKNIAKTDGIGLDQAQMLIALQLQDRFAHAQHIGQTVFLLTTDFLACQKPVITFDNRTSNWKKTKKNDLKITSSVDLYPMGRAFDENIPRIGSAQGTLILKKCSGDQVTSETKGFSVKYGAITHSYHLNTDNKNHNKIFTRLVQNLKRLGIDISNKFFNRNITVELGPLILFKELLKNINTAPNTVITTTAETIALKILNNKAHYKELLDDKSISAEQLNKLYIYLCEHSPKSANVMLARKQLMAKIDNGKFNAETRITSPGHLTHSTLMPAISPGVPPGLVSHTLGAGHK